MKLVRSAKHETVSTHSSATRAAVRGDAHDASLEIKPSAAELEANSSNSAQTYKKREEDGREVNDRCCECMIGVGLSANRGWEVQRRTIR